MMSTDSRPMLFSFSAASLVLGDSSAKVSTTAIRYSRANWERIARIPARYIFLLTLCEKFSSGEFGNARPPPRQMGEEVIPERARPVPFWRHGLLVLCLTVSRPLCARLPLRALAWTRTGERRVGEVGVSRS